MSAVNERVCVDLTDPTWTTFADSEIFTGIAYLGIICGQLGFGVIVDRYGRKSSMLTASCIMIVGSALCAGAYGANGSIDGMLAALVVYRFITGIGSTLDLSQNKAAARRHRANDSPPSFRSTSRPLSICNSVQCTRGTCSSSKSVLNVSSTIRASD